MLSQTTTLPQQQISPSTVIVRNWAHSNRAFELQHKSQLNDLMTKLFEDRLVQRLSAYTPGTFSFTLTKRDDGDATMIVKDQNNEVDLLEKFDKNDVVVQNVMTLIHQIIGEQENQNDSPTEAVLSRSTQRPADQQTTSMAELEARLAGSEEKIIALEAQNRKLHMQNSLSLATLQDERARNQSLEAQLTSNQSLMQSSTVKLGEFITIADTKIAELEGDLEKAQKKLAARHQDASSPHGQALEQLRTSLEQARAEKGAAEAKIAELTESHAKKVKGLNAYVERASEGRAAAYKELDALGETVQEKSDKIDDLEVQVAGLRQEAEAEKAAHTSMIDTKEREVAKLEGNLNTANAEKQKAQSDLEILQAELEQSKRTLALQEQLHAASEANTNKEIAPISSELATAEATLQENLDKIQALEEQVAGLMQKAADIMFADNILLKIKNASLVNQQGKIESLEKQLKFAKDEVKEALVQRKQTYVKAQKKVDALLNESANFLHVSEQARIELSKANALKNKAYAELEASKEEIAQLKDANDAALKKLKTLDETFAANLLLKIKNDRLEQELNFAKEEVKEALVQRQQTYIKAKRRVDEVQDESANYLHVSEQARMELSKANALKNAALKKLEVLEATLADSLTTNTAAANNAKELGRTLPSRND